MSERVVLTYGDSNTHGTMPMAKLEDMGRFGPDVRWPGVLAAELGPDWRVIEEGHPGRTTVHPDPVSGVHKNGIAVLPAILESHRPIDLRRPDAGHQRLRRRGSRSRRSRSRCRSRSWCWRSAQSFCGPDAGAPAVLVVCPPPVLEAGCLAEIFAGGAMRSGRLAGFLEPVARRQGAAFLDAGEVIVSSALDGVHYRRRRAWQARPGGGGRRARDGDLRAAC